ncbi:MAG: hypothetical protein JW812_00085 [Alphaproteobacteria bacterium]|nr:hypothetical protein [Alphaproteobacteria bacterium]MBN2780137.1 hypothetical protein [Alphaproteobacteria bacterium]
MSWTINSISKLKKLWDKGISTSEIGTKLGFSKNAIVGKAHRLGLKSRSNTVIKKIKRKKVPTPKVQIESPAPIESQTIKNVERDSSVLQSTPIITKTKSSGKKIKIIEMMDLKKDMCRWPLGDPRHPDFSFCGEPTFKNKPYCLTHCTEAYTLSNKKEEKVKDNDPDNSNTSEKL